MLVGHQACLRPRRRTHNMDLPHLRPDGVRAAAQHPLLGAGRASGGADLDIVDVSRFPRLAADSVIETEMGSEIPRDADLRDHCDEDERDQGNEQSDGARPGADRRKGEGQK